MEDVRKSTRWQREPSLEFLLVLPCLASPPVPGRRHQVIPPKLAPAPPVPLLSQQKAILLKTKGQAISIFFLWVINVSKSWGCACPLRDYVR